MILFGYFNQAVYRVEQDLGSSLINLTFKTAHSKKII